jgi:hypothetical protein
VFEVHDLIDAGTSSGQVMVAANTDVDGGVVVAPSSTWAATATSKRPHTAGVVTDGRGWFRTSDLSRVKRRA